jgi:hypothetical protein
MVLGFGYGGGAMATGSNIRVGDAEREVVATQLREHYADGRLTLDELNERLDQAFAAKTRTDLGAVTRDLPMGTRPVTGTPAGRVSAWQDATSGSSGSGSWSAGASGPGYRRPFAFVAPMLSMVVAFLVLGSLFAFGGIGGGRPLAVVFFLAALAFLRRLLGGRGRGRGRGRGPRGGRCGRW